MGFKVITFGKTTVFESFATYTQNEPKWTVFNNIKPFYKKKKYFNTDPDQKHQ